jgi:hypothetical protein
MLSVDVKLGGYEHHILMDIFRQLNSSADDTCDVSIRVDEVTDTSPAFIRVNPPWHHGQHFDKGCEPCLEYLEKEQLVDRSSDEPVIKQLHKNLHALADFRFTRN